jgi:hypothetical protein
MAFQRQISSAAQPGRAAADYRHFFAGGWLAFWEANLPDASLIVGNETFNMANS